MHRDGDKPGKIPAIIPTLATTPNRSQIVRVVDVGRESITVITVITVSSP
jgi:hypothetical protein